MHDRATTMKRLRVLITCLALALIGVYAKAVPPVSGLQPANNYGAVSVVIGTDSHGNVTATFTVTNTQPAGGYGIKGLIVYGPVQPISISAPPRTQTTLYQSSNHYSWWDSNGGPDTNGDGLVDAFIAPGQTVDDGNFILTYKPGTVLNANSFVFGLHVVVPFTGNTFFALGGGKTTGSLGLTVTPSATCVLNTGSVTFTYKLCNTGIITVTNITVTDNTGAVATGLMLAPQQCVSLTSTVTKPSASFTQNVTVSGTDANSHFVTTSGSAAITVSKPSLSVVASVDQPTVVAGTVDTFHYVVTNTGDVSISGIVLTATVHGVQAPPTAPITLAPMASHTFDQPITISDTTTALATVAGLDDCAHASASASSNTVTVTVVTPGLQLSVAGDQTQVCPLDTVIFTFTVKNTGNVDLKNVVVTDNDGVVGTIPTLAAGATDTSLTRSKTGLPVSTYTLTATASGLVVGTTYTQSAGPATATVKVVPCAVIKGIVGCDHIDVHTNLPMPIAGATVQLLLGSQVVSTTTTDAAGVYNFGTVGNGSYSIQITAKDFLPATFGSYPYDHDGADVVNTLTLAPQPITYRSVEALSGKIFFSNTSGFSSKADLVTTLHEGELYNAAYASPGFTVSYKYVGYIPHFPELGHFGGAGEPVIWVFIQQPLLPENAWNNFSFTNQVGVAGVQGTGAVGIPGNYTYRFLFSQPFDGPGTAYNYSLTNIESSAGSLNPTKMSMINPVWIGGAVAPAAPPPAGQIPAGWMGQGIGELSLAPGVTSTVYVDGSFENACFDNIVPIHIHPDLGGGPQTD